MEKIENTQSVPERHGGLIECKLGLTNAAPYSFSFDRISGVIKWPRMGSCFLMPL